MRLVNGNDPVLHQVAEEVPEGYNASLLLHVMWNVMQSHKGLGLAAPQIGESKRVITLNAGGLKTEIINPVITVMGYEHDKLQQPINDSFPQRVFYPACRFPGHYGIPGQGI